VLPAGCIVPQSGAAAAEFVQELENIQDSDGLCQPLPESGH